MAKAIDWRHYDRRKAQGQSGRQIAEALGVAESTLRGAIKRREASAHRPPSTVHSPPGQGPPSTVTPLPSTVGYLRTELSAALAIALQPVLTRLEALETGLARPALDAAPSTVHGITVDGPPSYPDTSTVHPATADPQTWELRQLKHSERWTIYVPRAMREEVKRRAAARGQHPSLLVQEALARWLAEET